jgi:glycine/D-amino acid oxidase-like deaminating enzyme
VGSRPQFAPPPAIRIASAVIATASAWFRKLRIAQVWAGAMDAIPEIEAVAQLPGMFLSTGYSGHDFGIAPGAGHLLADLIMGTQPLVDPQSFRFERLAR